MTKKKKEILSEIVFILDMTGSMQNLKDDAVGGFNSFMEEQKKVPGKCLVSLILFNSGEYIKVHDGIDIKKVSELTLKTYVPNHMTPLLETISRTIDEVNARIGETSKAKRPEKVIVAIMTDGQENQSAPQFTRRFVFDKITNQKETHKWEFIFMGANQDSYLEGGKLGFDAKDIKDFAATPKGLRGAYTHTSNLTAEYRTS